MRIVVGGMASALQWYFRQRKETHLGMEDLAPLKAVEVQRVMS